MNLLTYREKCLRWVPCGYGGCDEKEEEYLAEIENILLTDDELLGYLDNSSIIILNIIKLDQEQSEAFGKR